MLETAHDMVVERYFLTTRTSPVGLIKAWRAMRAVERSFDPDVAHAHFGTVTALLSVLTLRCPVVITYHGSDLNPTPTDGLLRDALGRCFSQLAALGASGIVCVSEGVRQRLWWRREIAEVIPIGTNTDCFMPMDRAACRKKLGWAENERVVLFNAGAPEIKRLDIAEAAVAIARQSIPALRLEALRGQVRPDEMPTLMNASDLLLICSDTEGSPTMVKEAMACNIPIVGTDVGDVGGRIAKLSPGRLVVQDPVSIARALLDVLREDRRSNGRTELFEQGQTSAVLDARVAALLQRCSR